jgi:hypothetical protein
LSKARPLLPHFLCFSKLANLEHPNIKNSHPSQTLFFITTTSKIYLDCRSRTMLYDIWIVRFGTYACLFLFLLICHVFKLYVVFVIKKEGDKITISDLALNLLIKIETTNFLPFQIFHIFLGHEEAVGDYLH